jgi:hypothetical protein
MEIYEIDFLDISVAKNLDGERFMENTQVFTFEGAR